MLKWYHKTLFVILFAGIALNGCLALALCDKQSEVIVGCQARDKLAYSVPLEALRPLPEKVNYIPLPKHKPVY